VDTSFFSIPDGLKFRGQRTLFKSWEKALTPPALRLLRENAVGEVGHNRNHSSDSPFLHTAPIQGAQAHDAVFESATCISVVDDELYMSRIMCFRGVPKKIVSDRGSQFTSKFWEKLHVSMDTRLNFSSAYHPQTNGQTERTNQILKDMLRACALKYGKRWNKSLPYAEFSYNNVGHHCSRVRLEKVRYSDQKY
jgi:hypothetical protein